MGPLLSFQLTLQEWLLLELGVPPDKDLLSAPERWELCTLLGFGLGLPLRPGVLFRPPQVLRSEREGGAAWLGPRL